MQPLESIESLWFIAQFETAKLLNCIRSAKIHSRTVEEIWKIKCHLSTVENFYLSACAAANMLHTVMIDDDSRLHLTYLVMSCRPRGCLLLNVAGRHKLYRVSDTDTFFSSCSFHKKWLSVLIHWYRIHLFFFSFLFLSSDASGWQRKGMI